MSTGGAQPPDYALRDEVPTLEELVVSGELGDVRGTTSHPLFIAPFPCDVRQVSLVQWYGAVPANDRMFWTVKLWRVRAGVSTDIAVKTTRPTSGEAVRTRVAWTFDQVPFGAARSLDKGDVVALAFYATGSPPPLKRLAATLRYSPR
jgi:hypothetical protein